MYSVLLILSAAAMTFFVVVSIAAIFFKKQTEILKRAEKVKKSGTNEAPPAVINVKKNKIKYQRRTYKKKREYKYLKVLESQLQASGIMIRPDEFLLLWVFISFLPATIFFFFVSDPIPAIALMCCCIALPPFFVNRTKKKKVAKFESQLSEALTVICNCMRSGLSFTQAISSISKEMPDPIASEFKRVLNEVQWGTSIDVSLYNMAKRIGSEDFSLAVSSIIICRQVGGNLSEMLFGISETIKKRLALKDNIKLLTATGRTSGMIIGFLPVVIALILMLINPTYIHCFFETSLGRIMIFVALILETIGFLLIRKITNIKF
ncbi:MAG: type II secretion system F family protein [Bacillota bacterium]|nr:type II secretion system F family protein [Bacillota bacterium]